jgi:transposase
MDIKPIFIGIDVSKAHLDSAIRPGNKAAARHPNDSVGIAALVSRLKPLAPTLVVVEATGGLELPLVRVPPRLLLKYPLRPKGTSPTHVQGACFIGFGLKLYFP